MSQFIINQ